MPVPSDIEIAQAAKLEKVEAIAEKCGVLRDELELHGDYKAKVKLELIDRVKDAPDAKYIDVTAITPTPLGEGKTVTTIGLTQGLGHIGKRVITCIRQPSQGVPSSMSSGGSSASVMTVSSRTREPNSGVMTFPLHPKAPTPAATAP